MITQKDIAKRLGVSRSLVSMVLNKHPAVSTKTREKISNAIRELNYHPSLAARSLALTRKQTLTIVFLSSRYNTGYSFIYFDLLHGIYSYLRNNGYNLDLYFREETQSFEETYIDLRENYRYDGIIFDGESSVVPQIVSAKVPYVVINRKCSNASLNCIYASGTDGIYEVTKHLISLSHRRVAYIGGNCETTHFKQRLEGYRQAISENKIPHQDSYIKLDAMDRKDGYLAMKDLLSESLPPTAVVADNDFKAMGAIEAVKEASLRVPEDIAVTGFDDMPLASSYNPPLTTVYHPRFEVGREASKVIIELIKGKIKKLPIRFNLSDRLVIRKSCGAYLKSERRFNHVR